MPAFRLGLPFMLLLGLGLYLTIEVHENWSILMIIAMVIIVAGFILAPQINWWWWQRFPPDLPTEMTQLLEKHAPLYSQLSEDDKREFRRRVFLFNHGNNFMPQVLEKMPLDAQVMIAYAPVTMTFHKEAFLLPKFENIIVYPHPFPSPQYETKFHASEIYEPDGVVMFCLEHVLRGFVDPRQYLNPAWYEYAKVFAISYPNENLGDWNEVTWSKLETVSGFSGEALERWIGLPDLDLRAMGIAFFFLFPARFQEVLPEQYEQLAAVFRHK